MTGRHARINITVHPPIGEREQRKGSLKKLSNALPGEALALPEMT